MYVRPSVRPSVSLPVCSSLSVYVCVLSASVRVLVSVNAFDTHAGRRRRAILIGAGRRCWQRLLLLLRRRRVMPARPSSWRSSFVAAATPVNGWQERRLGSTSVLLLVARQAVAMMDYLDDDLRHRHRQHRATVYHRLVTLLTTAQQHNRFLSTLPKTSSIHDSAALNPYFAPIQGIIHTSIIIINYLRRRQSRGRVLPSFVLDLSAVFDTVDHDILSYKDGFFSTDLHLNGFVFILLQGVLRCSVSVQSSLLLVLFYVVSLKALCAALYNSTENSWWES